MKKTSLFIIISLLLMLLLPAGCGKDPAVSAEGTLPFTPLPIGEEVPGTALQTEATAEFSSAPESTAETVTESATEPLTEPPTTPAPTEPPTEPMTTPAPTEPPTEPPTTPAPTEPPTEPPTTPAPTEPPTEPPTTPAPSTQAPAQPVSGNGYTICLDPGHQGAANYEQEPVAYGSSETKMKVSDGTRGKTSGIRESVVNLRISLQLRDELEARGYRVVMTRTSEDVNISNIERAELANSVGADLFLRLHCDGSEAPSWNGISIQCGSASNSYNGHLYDQSRRISELLLAKMCAATGAYNRGVNIRADMSGLNWSLVPCCLIEMGFLTNEAEEQKLLSADYQHLLVISMADAVDAYFGR